MKRKHRWVPTIHETCRSPAILHLDCIQLCIVRYWWGDSIIAGGQGVWRSSKLEKKPVWTSQGEGRNWLCLWVIPADDATALESIAMKAVMVMPNLLLQRPRTRSKTKTASVAWRTDWESGRREILRLLSMKVAQSKVNWEFTRANTTMKEEQQDHLKN